MTLMHKVSSCFLLTLSITLWLVFSSISPLAAQDGVPGGTVVDLLARRPALRPRIGLALSGGGARGLAHIGVLKALVDAGIPIDDIAGSSMGAVIGGLYAAGYTPDDLQHLALTTAWDDLMRDRPSRTSLFVTQKMTQPNHTVQMRFHGLRPYVPGGLSAGQKLRNLFASLTASATYLAGGDFNQLPVPFQAVAMDLTTGDEVVIDHGDLAEALRASIAVPFLLTPIDYQGRLLVDGGVVDPIPVDVVRSMGADLVIAVDIQNSLRTRDRLITPWDVIDQVISVKVVQEARAQKARADVVISPEVGNHASSDFTRIGDLIRAGMEGTMPCVPRIRELLAQQRAQRPAVAAGADVMEEDSPRHSRSQTAERLVLTEIDLSGLVVANRDTLLARMRSKPGLTIDLRQLDQDGRAILRWYHDQGYTLA
ncbi:MAG: patatin-like phospholipase family protein, partial [Candidatus Latescibacteria bacterium]|nr:patatin-like phospholipase family protein [Candidatus Latescibacterota bacterium]